MHQKKEFIKLNISSLLINTSFFIAIYPSLSYLANSLNISKVQIGTLFAIIHLCAMGSKFVSGVSSQYVSKKTLLLIGSFFLIFGSCIFYMASNAYMIYIGSIAYGLSGFYSPISVSCVYSIFEKKNYTRAFGTFTLIGGVGWIIGPSLSGFILDYTNNNFKILYLVTIAFSIMSLIVIFTLNLKPGVAGNSGKQIRKSMFNPNIIKISTSRLLNSVPIGLVFPMFPLLALQNGIEASTVGLLLATQKTSAILSRKLVSYLTTESNRVTLIVLGTGLFGATSILCALTTHFILLFLVFILMGLAEGLCVIPTLSYLGAKVTSSTFPMGIAMVGTFHDIGKMSGSIIAGIIAATLELPATFYIIGTIIIFFGFVIKLLLSKK